MSSINCRNREVRAIKEHHIKPAFIKVEAEKDGKHYTGRYYQIAKTIWLDVKLPDYKIPVPQTSPARAINPKKIEPTYYVTSITYRPTGQCYYYSDFGESCLFIWEYELVDP